MKHHILLATCAVSVLTLAAGSVLAADAAAANTSGTTIGELVVTAERREENLQDTPIAVSAFSAQSLSSKGLNGGQDLLLQIPNANYTRGNFGGFDFKIRGIGVDVVAFSGTTGVSINENELPVASNNFANTDFYDVQRVEVLRGPQGTLYGRNATGGAVDIITNQPTSDFGGYASVGYGNYDAIKVTGAVNIPLGDDWALRVAGFRYLQNGFGENTYLNQSVDGRDLGSVRATLSFKPNDKFNAYIMYEHYGENDDRNRIGKQLCITDPGPSSVGGVPIAAAGGTPVGNILNNYAAFLNQGCLPGSLYQPAAYGAVNSNATFLATGNLVGLNNGTNVFADNPLQDTNLHDIESITQPKFTSYEDLIEIHASYNISDSLTLTSITGFNRATGTSLEDYNRIVPDLPFTPTGNAFFGALPLALFPNGEVNDPQIGTTNKFATFDYGTAESNEYTEELRLQSSFKGPVNFSAGLFYSEETSPLGSNNYFVFSNALTGSAYANNAAGGALLGGPIYTDPSQVPTGSGHNYYDARDGGGFLKTYAGFAEVYWQLTPTLKLTLGGRYNVDQLYNLSYPISVLVAANNGTPFQTNGYNGSTGYAGFPTTICTTSLAACLIPQGVTYREFTGRANLDWTPTLSFTDKTLVYATYSRGYKGGGFNTPCQTGLGTVGSVGNNCPYPLSYNPEFIDAFEVGTKNTMLGGSLTVDLDGFYYNYNGYQISSIVDKSSVNLNINAKIYGAEFESAYSPIRNFTVNANIGYLHTRIDNNQYEVDTLNLTQGNPNYTLLHADDGTACLAPTNYLAALIAGGAPAPFLSSGNIPGIGQAFAGACNADGYATGNAIAGNANYVNFANVNGVPVNLGGKQLPNSPNWTVSLGAQYVFDLPDDWRATLRGDYYWQGQSWARVFNAVNDELQAYHVVNATLTFAQSTNGLEVKLWVKNLFNAQPITGVYLTNDTSGLFQNVFTLDPRTYGVQLTKRF
jgi:outer membrane receptor protein involved in Fe transport